VCLFNDCYTCARLFDAIVLAKARKLGAKVVTGDEHLKHADETLWIVKI